MLLVDARREARLRNGEVVLPAEQDRSRWNHSQIAAGRAAFDRAIVLHESGPYVIQGAIASLHVEHEPEWSEIAALYGVLFAKTRSPVVQLNRAVSIGQAGSPEVAVAIIGRLDLGDYHYLHAARAAMLQRLGRHQEARTSYRRALELVTNDAERRFLELKLDERGCPAKWERRSG
jgi:RNA polymerase sigma-70 factor, ECF subfamily